MKNLHITNTLKAIRQYKNGIGGNYMELSEAIKKDASNFINSGKPVAFWMIEARNSGQPFSEEEKKAFHSIYNRCVSDAMQVIFNRIYKVLPAGLKNCKLYKNDMRWFGGW